jgi:putative ABC transport system permease protein
MSALLRRAWTFRGYLGLLGGLAVVAVLIISGGPRLVNHLTDSGLRHRIEGLPYQVRDLTYELTADPGTEPPAPRQLLDTHRRTFAAPLAGLVEQQWYAAQVGPTGLGAVGADLPVNVAVPPAIGLRGQPELAAAATLAEGRWPAAPAEPAEPGRPAEPAAPPGPAVAGVVEAAVSTKVARGLGLRLGSRFRLSPTGQRTSPVEVVIVGRYDAVDPLGAIWAQERELLHPFVPVGEDNAPYRGVLVTHPAGIEAAAATGAPVTHTWRYRVAADRLDAGGLDDLTTAVVAARQRAPLWTTTMTGLDTELTKFADRLATARALLAIVQAGVLATLAGLVLLAAAAAVDQRRAELSLLRARGGTLATIGARTLAESLLVVPVAAALGGLAAAAVPGRPAGTVWLAVLFVLATAAALPVLAVAGNRHVSATPSRRDLSRRASPGRLTAEATLMITAVVGIVLLRHRGLDGAGSASGPGSAGGVGSAGAVGSAGGVDPYLASVPVLLSAAAALLAVRILPVPVRLVGRLAARGRSSVLFLGLARAGRAARASVGPVAVMVVAIATGVFSAIVTTTVDEARDRATDEAVPAAARLTGGPYTLATADRVGEVAGVTAVAPLAVGPAGAVFTDRGRSARRVTQSLVVAVDVPSFARVAAASGVRPDLPAVLAKARLGAGPVPALVSPTIAAELAARGSDGSLSAAVDLQGTLYAFRVAAVAERFPTVPADARRFVVLPWQALPETPAGPLLPTGFLVAGADPDGAALSAAGDRGHLDWLAATAPGTATDAVTTVTTWRDYRRDLANSGLNELLRFTFAAGAIAGTALALLAIAFAVLAGARSRGRVLSRLRTLGMSPAQGRGVLMLELGPMIGVGIVTGALVGVALALLLAPALGLSSFTAGYPAGVHLDAAVVGGVLGLVLLGLLTAVAVESAINRRLRLGAVLRLGEEN